MEFVEQITRRIFHVVVQERDELGPGVVAEPDHLEINDIVVRNPALG